MSRNIALTNTERSVLASCEQLWLLRYGLGLDQIGLVSRPLVIGRIWHEALSAWWGSALHMLNTNGRYERAHAVLVKEFDEFERLASRKVFSTATPVVSYTLEEVHEMRELLFGMLAGYNAEYELDASTVLLNESRIRGLVRTESGAVSWVRYEGTLDKLVDERGERWIIEHKTSSTNLLTWRGGNAYRPQALAYAWLVEAYRPALKPVGVVYDLALTMRPPPIEAFKVVGKGTEKNPRRLSKVTPTGATVAMFEAALAANGFSVDDQPYYAEKLEALRAKPVEYFHRIYVRFAPGEIRRVARELYYIATRARQYRARTEDVRVEIATIATGAYADWRVIAVEYLEAHGHEYPRNGYYCRRYNRTCALYDLCRYQSLEALSQFRPRATYHPEHRDDSSANNDGGNSESK